MNIAPEEMWLHIINMLPLNDLVSFSGVSQLANIISKRVRRWNKLEAMKYEIGIFRKPISLDQVKGWPNIAFLQRLYFPDQVTMINHHSLYQCYGHLQNIYFSIHKYHLTQRFGLPSAKRIYSLEYSVMDDDVILKEKSIPHIIYTPENWDNEESLDKIIIPKKSILIRYSNIIDLSPFSHLHSISLVSCDWVTDISPLKNIPHISITYCNMITSIDLLGKHQNILQIHACLGIRNYDTIGNIPSIDLTSNILTTLNFLGKGVKNLILKDCTLFNLDDIGRAINLETLDLSQCTYITDISPLSSLTKLKSLQLRGCTKIIDISPLSSLRELEMLDISHTSVKDICPLIKILPSAAVDGPAVNGGGGGGGGGGGKLTFLKLINCRDIEVIPVDLLKIKIYGDI